MWFTVNALSCGLGCTRIRVSRKPRPDLASSPQTLLTHLRSQPSYTMSRSATLSESALTYYRIFSCEHNLWRILRQKKLFTFSQCYLNFGVGGDSALLMTPYVASYQKPDASIGLRVQGEAISSMANPPPLSAAEVNQEQETMAPGIWRSESILRLVFLGQKAPAEEDTVCQASLNVPCTLSLLNSRLLAFFVLGCRFSLKPHSHSPEQKR